MNIKHEIIDVFSLKVKTVNMTFSANGMSVEVEDTVISAQSKKEIYDKLDGTQTSPTTGKLHVLPEIYEQYLKENNTTKPELFSHFCDYIEREHIKVIKNQMAVEELPSSDMMTPISLETFAATGLLVIVNQILHAFGLVLYKQYDYAGKFIGIFPATTKFRGFSEKSTSNAYEKVAKWISDNHEQILKDAEGK